MNEARKAIINKWNICVKNFLTVVKWSGTETLEVFSNTRDWWPVTVTSGICMTFILIHIYFFLTNYIKKYNCYRNISKPAMKAIEKLPWKPLKTCVFNLKNTIVFCVKNTNVWLIISQLKVITDINIHLFYKKILNSAIREPEYL